MFVKQNSIGHTQTHIPGWVQRVHHTIGRNDEGRFMSAVAVGQFARSHIDDGIKNRDKKLARVLVVQPIVDFRENFSRRPFFLCDRAKGDVGHGHEQRSAQSFSRDVGNRQADPLIVDFKHIVEVAADLAGGAHICADFVEIGIGEIMGKDGFLHGFCQFDVPCHTLERIGRDGLRSLS